MTYNETIAYLYKCFPAYQNLGSVAYKPGLENTHKLDDKLNSPHKNYKTIHVAGTNGKGSVSHMIASVLQEEGYKVGLYTSPHLKDFRERIRINGKKITKEYVCGFVSENKKMFEEIQPSFFEATMCMAFQYFSDKNIDIAIIEVGLGGRLDSTNIINPILSIITNISLDHQNLLGETLEKIAFEKAGIIKSNTPVIIGDRHEELKELFLNISERKNTTCSFTQEDISLIAQKEDQLIVNYKEIKNIKVSLNGSYQLENLDTALLSIDKLNDIGVPISEKAIYRGLKNVKSNTGIIGRWQQLHDKPLTLCDTGHNEDAIKKIVKQLTAYNYKTLRIVFGLAKDKNSEKIIDLLPKDACYYFCKASTDRAMDEQHLFTEAQQANLKGKVFKTVKEAFNAAKKDAKEDDLIFIGGSNFIVAEVI